MHGRIGQKLWHRAVLEEQEDGGSMTQEKQVPETEVCYGKIYRPERAVKIIKKDGSRAEVILHCGTMRRTKNSDRKITDCRRTEKVRRRDSRRRI